MSSRHFVIFNVKIPSGVLYKACKNIPNFLTVLFKKKEKSVFSLTSKLKWGTKKKVKIENVANLRKYMGNI